MLDLFIQNADIVGEDRVYRGSIGVKEGKTALLADAYAQYEAASRVDASGCYVFPGFIDCHAHLNDPGYTWREDFAHGSSAAATGGVTTIIDMPLQNIPALTTAGVFLSKERAIQGRSAVDYCFWGGFIDDNLSDLEALADAGAVALKAFLSPVSEGYTSVDTGLARQAMKIAAKRGILLGFHCEDYAIIAREETSAKAEHRNSRLDYLCSRPVSAELIATANILALAEETGAKVHICHVSHPDVAELIKQAQSRGVAVTAETCAHYLVFTENDLLERGMLYKCAPPLRAGEAAERLWRYVVDGTLCCIGSDHSPAEACEKSEEVHGVFGAWGGISGLQHFVQVFYDHAVNRRGLSPTLVARRTAGGPAQVFGLYGKKGAISPGFDADYVIFDPKARWRITRESLLYKNKISAYIGVEGIGAPVATILRGIIVARGGELAAENIGRLIRKSDS